ncbi:hypothetical protein A8C32_15320 [Flavivirga aquatica]|uniref:Thioesterase n=1 Tax=Flavivirga aquatica TaxID=1849968 RepID=A0A1E5T8Z3_9FLAO|nr:hypothetical protein [Flavivirga aquatica]OEK07850.1 hypothetical protein A8C32_15320 [Flavivirga aquatica]
MFRQKYKVQGEDVDDFMVMENTAYFNYSTSIFNIFLSEKGYSKRKRDALKIILQESKECFIRRKDLMFTQEFFVNLELFDIDNAKQKLNIRSRFFNANNELCAITIGELYWNDSTLLKNVIARC